VSFDPRLIADAGGWAAFVSFVGLLLYIVRRGDFVARFVYDRETQRADKLDRQVDKNNEALRDGLASVASELRDIKKELQSTREQLDDLHWNYADRHTIRRDVSRD
jgi:hypothetical protein